MDIPILGCDSSVARGTLGLRGHERQAEGKNIMRHTNAWCARSLLELGEYDSYVLGSRRPDASWER